MADENGNKTGGRKEGTVNKRTQVVMDLIDDSPLSPIDFDLAVLNWDLEKLGISEEQEKMIDIRTQIEMRQKASDGLKPHAYPKLKATEINIKDDEGKGKVFTLAYAIPPKKDNGSS